jgi:diguanylate cyclase (GGDEF)-like protein
MSGREARHWAYNLLLVAGVGTALHALLPADPVWPPAWFYAACVAFQLFVWHFGLGVPYIGLMSMERVPQVAVLLTLEPALAAIVNASSSLLWPFINRLYNQGSLAVAAQRAVHNACMTLAMTLAAGSIYLAMGGRLPLATLDLATLVPIVAAALTMQAVNLAMMVVYYWLDGRDLRRILTPFYVLGDLIFVPVGVLAALLYHREPAPVFGLFFGLLLAQVLMAHAIGHARVQLEDRVAALDRATAAGQQFSGAKRIDELAQHVYDQIATLFRFDLFYLATYDAGRDVFDVRLQEAHGKRHEPFAVPAQQGLAGWVRRTGEAILIDRWELAPQALRERAVLARDEVPGSVLVVPVQRQGQLLGLISLQHAQPEFYSAADKNLLQEVARAAAPALADAAAFEQLDGYRVGLERRVAERTAELERVAQERQKLVEDLAAATALLTRQSREDALTGLPNRRHFDECLAEEIARAGRHDHPLSLVLADLDHFKSINDSHGHAIGDEVLRQVASLIRRHCRAADIIARYGGEEFVLLMPETPLEGAVRVAETLRVALEGHAWESIHPELRVTMSFGVVRIAADVAPGALVSYADDMLYLAKHNGRNRVESGSR